MLYETFNLIRERIKTIPELKTVQWYNAQYEGTIYTTPIAFIEFPERIPLEEMASTALRGDFALRVHIVSSVVASQDSSIPDVVIIDHEQIAKQVLEKLRGNQVRMGGGKTTSLVPCGWQHWHKYKGWMVTFVEFKASAIGMLE